MGQTQQWIQAQHNQDNSERQEHAGYIPSSSQLSNRSCLGIVTCCHSHLKASLLFFNYRTQLPSGHLTHPALSPADSKLMLSWTPPVSQTEVRIQRDRVIFILILETQQSLHSRKLFLCLLEYGFLQYSEYTLQILTIYFATNSPAIATKFLAQEDL